MAKKKLLSTECRKEAELLAMQPYSVLVIRDTTAHGEPILVAVNPELDGCMAHGKTSEEAIENLKEARIDYLQVCLLSETPIPTPVALEEEYISSSGTVIIPISYNPPKKDTFVHQIAEVTKPEKCDVVMEYAFRILSPSEAK
jgi:predicted RNase H-like HicB family nuclease